MSLVILLVECNIESDTFEVEAFPFVIQSQKVKARIWKDRELEPVNVLDADAGVQRPREAFDDERGNLFTIDYWDSRVKKYDADGKLIQTYGDGVEQALGEHGRPPIARKLSIEFAECFWNSISYFIPVGGILRLLYARYANRRPSAANITKFQSPI